MARLLVIEDTILDRAIVRFLEGAGHDVQVAVGVTEAGVLLEQGSVRLLLTNVENRGRKLLSFIEDARRQRPGLAVLVLCSQSNADVGRQLEVAGVAEMLQLPVTFVGVRDRVRRALDLRDLSTPITDLRSKLRRLQSGDLSAEQREILVGAASDLDTLDSRARSVTRSR